MHTFTHNEKIMHTFIFYNTLAYYRERGERKTHDNRHGIARRQRRRRSRPPKVIRVLASRYLRSLMEESGLPTGGRWPVLPRVIACRGGGIARECVAWSEAAHGQKGVG